jgi:small subunit ribosomal protein S18|tara:strand:- start:401 stop:628 length:228 start_codon:yes stop_codon:yes gene_type:complete
MYNNSKLSLRLDIDEETIDSLDYKNIDVLSAFISDQGKILPRRTTNLTSQQQKKVQKLIKRARIASLLPFVMGKS